ncbi:trypsin-like cysteine/serine peptidase domain-containing protein, partial [Syncephalis fuscata]
ILTAAHCAVDAEKSEEAGKVVLEDPSTYRINIGQDSNITYTPIVPKTIYAHPKYNWTEFINDIALLELGTSIQFNAAIQPVRLIKGESNLLLRQMFTVVGWGSDTTQKLVSTLNRVNVLKGSSEFCAKALPSYQPYFNQLLCTENGFGKNVCHGDSGSPL